MVSIQTNGRGSPLQHTGRTQLAFLLMDPLPDHPSHAFPDSEIAKEVKCVRTQFTANTVHS